MSKSDYARNTNPFFKVLQDLDTITIVDREDDLKSMLKRFTKVGISYKGSNQYCYRADGESGSLALSVDPVRAKTGLFSTQFTGAIGGGFEKKSFMILHRGISLSHSDKPISLNSLVGYRWSGSCDASVFLGISVKPDILSLSPPAPDTVNNPNAPELLGLASMAMIPSITAGGTISGSASCDVFYAEDKYPLYFEPKYSKEIIEEKIKALIELGSFKSFVKQEAVNFIKHNNPSSRINLMQNRLVYERRTPISQIKNELTELRDSVTFGMSTPESLKKKQQLEQHIFLLDLWDKGANLPTVPTFLRAVSYSAGFEGKLNAEAGALKQNIGIKAECSGSYIPTTTTFQSVYPLKDINDSVVCTTQTTNINYKKVDFAATAEIKTAVIKKKSAIAEGPTVMSISYICSTVVWKYLIKSTNNNSADLLHFNRNRSSSVIMEKGSGISVGNTYDIDSLLLFYKKDDDGNFIAPGIDPYQDMPEQASRTAQVYQALNNERHIGLKILQWAGFKSPNSMAAFNVINELIKTNAEREVLRSVFEWILGIRPDKPTLPETITNKLQQPLSTNSQFRPIVQRYYNNFINAEQESEKAYNPHSYMPTEEAYLRTVASSLHISFEQLREFFLSPAVFETLIDLKSPQDSKRKGPGVNNIILEASFCPENLDSVDLIKRTTPTRTSIELSDKSIKSTLTAFAKNIKTYELESLAIRYHQQDKQDDGRSFSPGISVLGTGAGIKIKRIEESGSAAVVEILRTWFSKDLAQTAKNDPAGAFESAIPPVTLFLR